MPSDLTLVLRFDAPMQAWGIGDLGWYRSTELEPTFSGVVGMIANAMGRRRSDPINDLAVCNFATRTDRAGHLIRDFYTVGVGYPPFDPQATDQPRLVGGIASRKEKFDDRYGRQFVDKPGDPKKDVIVAEKEYLTGAVFTAALAGPPNLIRDAAAALTEPARIFYLGRKSCPITRPPVEAILHHGDVEKALTDYPVDPAIIPAKGRARRGWHADERLKLVVPTSPLDPSATLRYDVPVSFAPGQRSYLARYVTTKHLDLNNLTGDTP